MTRLAGARPTAPASAQRVRLVFAGLVVAKLLASLDQTVFSTALPTIVGELDGAEHVLWVTTAYVLASTVVLPVYGKLGDLIGRKRLFITAIGIFMLGSVVGGIADSMGVLIAGRAVQGLGGGGLMVLAWAIIADIVPARQRGRYAGVMGAVFAVSSVAGPLLGGFFTDGPGWRWAFWMNLPLGSVAIVLAAAFLRPPVRPRVRARIDLAGIALLSVAATSMVLFTTWGGTTYGWGSPVILGLIIATIVSTGLFIFVEFWAAEPVLPLTLFRNRNFVLATGAGLIAGIALFGVLAYMPTHLQMVTGVGAAHAGLLMIPATAAVLLASIGSGQIVTRTGHYKAIPIIGMFVTALSLFLLSNLTAQTPTWIMCLYLALMGTGLGMSTQILILIVQNSTPDAIVGVATSANTFFREIGAAFGAAVVGSVFVARLSGILASTLPGEATGSTWINSLTPKIVTGLPTLERTIVVAAYNDALVPIFLLIAPIAALAGVMLMFVVERPLATRVGGEPST